MYMACLEHICIGAIENISSVSEILSKVKHSRTVQMSNTATLQLTVINLKCKCMTFLENTNYDQRER